ncbi:hypothetical protein MMC07_001740 [Pseudocyphellaria aurata]|nr:hypothetical protein [Pseudocyphellaria aurata]
MTVAAAIKAGRAPEVVTTAYEDHGGKVICLYITAWIGSEPVENTLVDSGSVVALISRGAVERLNLKVYDMGESWTLQLADDGYAAVCEYVWVQVNVGGVGCVVKAYVLGDGKVYDLLLGVRRHPAHRLRVEANSKAVEFVGVPSVDQWESEIAEEVIARVIEELDTTDLATDKLKGEHP